MIRKAAIVRGQVQGVGFRYSAREQAERLALAGFVRNSPNGTVELEIEGDEPSVGRMLDWLAVGPAWAAVESVEVSDLEPLGVRGFRIVH
jgi:Acylphosphatases